MRKTEVKRAAAKEDVVKLKELDLEYFEERKVLDRKALIDRD